MSADLPDSDHHRGYMEMARSLVTYMADPAVIRQAIKREFNQAPTERTIELLRAEYLASLEKPVEPPHKPHEGYYPLEASRTAAARSIAFLARLEAERAVSKASRKSLATIQDFVDKRWNADILSARLEVKL